MNESFQKWILEPDKEVQHYWVNWMNAHPEKADLIAEARLTIQTIQAMFEKNVSDDHAQVWDRIANSIHDLESEALLRHISEKIENTKRNH